MVAGGVESAMTALLERTGRVCGECQGDLKFQNLSLEQKMVVWLRGE